MLRANSENLNGESTFDRYMDFSEIQKYLSKLQQTYPYKVQLSTIGQSYKNENITMVAITNDVKRKLTKKPIIFVEAGMHSREWVGVASALYVINELVKGAGTPFTKFVEWRIVPVSNPDGYQYTWTQTDVEKNLRRPRWCNVQGLTSTDFDSYWGASGSSKRECSQIYAGKNAFSESETRAIRDAFLEVKDRIKAYVSIHNYGQFILHPPSHSEFYVNEECSKLLDSVAIEMAQVIKNSTSAKFTYGPPPKLLYPASGTSMDWAYANGNIPLVFTFELRDEGASGFLLPEDQIYLGVTEFWEAMNVVYVKVVDILKTPTAGCSPNTSSTPSTPSSSPPSEPHSSRRLSILRKGIFNEGFTGREVYMLRRSESSEELSKSSESSEEELRRVWF
ncbi:Zinc carboxypeptidase [Armadillidium vulgare]|nr:Zinc carboxypeptidase [Armadillidium vulgare]